MIEPRARNHALRRRLCDEEGPVDVGAHDRVEFLGREIDERCTILYSRVVYDNINEAELLLDSVHFADDSLTIGHICDRCRGGEPFVFQIARSRFRSLAIATVKNDGCASAREAARERKSDAPVGARHQGNFSIQREQGVEVTQWRFLSGRASAVRTGGEP